MTTNPTTVTNFSTREEWLVAATKELTEIFSEAGATVPAVRLSVGWPGGRGSKHATIGQCWAPAASTDGVAQIFISPVLDDALRVLDVLAHELVHAVDGCVSGHRGPFAKLAKKIGLTGKMTATVVGPELLPKLEKIVEKIGAYPHAALNNPALAAEGPKKQSARMIKAECMSGSGYKVRLTRQWIDEVGAPICPCHREEMLVD